MKGKEKNGLSTKALMGVQVNYGKLRYCGRDENSWWAKKAGVKRPVGRRSVRVHVKVTCK